MKKYNIVSVGVGHKAVEADNGQYVLSSEFNERMRSMSSEIASLSLENRSLKSKNNSLECHAEEHSTFCQWNSVANNPPKSMSTDVDAPIRLGWDGSNELIRNAILGYCVHVGDAKIWLDCKGKDLNLSPMQQPTHWGAAMLPPGV